MLRQLNGCVLMIVSNLIRIKPDVPIKRGAGMTALACRIGTSFN